MEGGRENVVSPAMSSKGPSLAYDWAFGFDATRLHVLMQEQRHARFFLQGVEAIVWMFPSCADMGEAAAAAGEEPRDEDNAALLRAFFLSVSRFLVRTNGSSTPEAPREAPPFRPTSPIPLCLGLLGRALRVCENETCSAHIWCVCVCVLKPSPVCAGLV